MGTSSEARQDVANAAQFVWNNPGQTWDMAVEGIDRWTDKPLYAMAQDGITFTQEALTGGSIIKLPGILRKADDIVPDNINPGGSFTGGVRFFGEQDLRHYILDDSTLGSPSGNAFFMPLEDSGIIANRVDAARYTGMSPSIVDANAAAARNPGSGDIFGVSFPTDGLDVRVPSVGDSVSPHFLPGGNTAVRLPEPNGGYLVNPTREFITPGNTRIPEGSVLFKLGSEGEWIPLLRY